jgi:hypothetical protein
LKDLRETHLDLILSGNGAMSEQGRIKEAVQKARGAVFRDHDLFVMQQLCKKVVKDLSHTPIVFNARQLKMALRLLKAGLALKSATNMEEYSNVDANTAYIASTIPELHGVVRASVDVGMVRGTIRSVVSGFSLGDPLITASSLEELCDIQTGDNLAWVTAIREMTTREENARALEKAARSVRERVSQGNLERELGERLMRELTTRLLTVALTKEQVSIPHLRERAREIAGALSATREK